MNSSCSGSSTSVVMVVRGQDRAAAAGDLDDRPAVGRFQHRAIEHPGGWADGDLAAIEAEDRVPAARLLEVVGGDDDAVAFSSQGRDQLLQALGGWPVEAGEGLI